MGSRQITAATYDYILCSSYIWARPSALATTCECYPGPARVLPWACRSLSKALDTEQLVAAPWT